MSWDYRRGGGRLNCRIGGGLKERKSGWKEGEWIR